MSREATVTCDRCGTTVVDPGGKGGRNRIEGWVRLTVSDDPRGTPTGYDLCTDCGRALAAFMDEAEKNTIDIAIPIRPRVERVSAAGIEAGLRRQGWTDDMLGPDMKACLTEIAEGLDKMRQECPPVYTSASIQDNP